MCDKKLPTPGTPPPAESERRAAWEWAVTDALEAIRAAIYFHDGLDHADQKQVNDAVHKVSALFAARS